MAELMSKNCRTFLLILVLLGVMVSAVFWVLHPMRWRDVAEMTGVEVPAGAVMSMVEHPMEGKFRGTIVLKSEADAQAFIRLNDMSPMTERADDEEEEYLDDLVHEFPKERYADIYMLCAHTDHSSWKFILDPTTRRVRYQILVKAPAYKIQWIAPTAKRPP